MKPMLASATDGNDLTYPKLVSPKLDGIRCLNISGVAVSRNLKEIPNRQVQTMFGCQSLNGLDGELIVGPITAKDVFQVTTSGVMTRAGTPGMAYWVFDTFLSNQEFQARLELVRRRVNHSPLAVRVVPHELVRDQAELLAFETRCLKSGFEGVMLRDPQGPYKQGRSTLKEGWLLKLKRFDDSEAMVIGVNQLMSNTNPAELNALGQLERSSHQAGMKPLNEIGALVVRDLKTAVEFELGTGFTTMQRFDFWMNRKKLPGRIVKYKFQAVGVKDKPRFPVFLGWRDERDL